MELEVSTGEVVDKYTILCIKRLMIYDRGKVENVEKEWEYLKYFLHIEEPGILEDPLTEELHKINKELWDVEDRIRDCERNKIFEGEFISLARSVYRLNDHRASIKKQINLKYGSIFVEEKSYKEY